MSKNTIPKKALVALPDFTLGTPPTPNTPIVVVPPELARVSAFDRSFHFGDSLYEVTRSYEGILFSLDEHLRRLLRSAELAMFEERIDIERIGSIVRDTCRAFFRKFGNRVERQAGPAGAAVDRSLDVYVRIMVSRGISDLNIDRGLSSSPYPVVVVKELEPVPQKMYDEGVHYAVVSRRRNHPMALDPAMKSGNYLNNVLALAEAKRMGAYDALMLSHQGFVTEGTTNNVFAVKNGEVWTAPLSVGILAGITRDWIFQVCRDEGIAVQERLFTEAELADCQEMFLSSSVKEIMPITTLTGRPVGSGKPGPVTQRLHARLRTLIQDYTRKRKTESLYL